jgi:hypothetical protein
MEVTMLCKMLCCSFAATVLGASLALAQPVPSTTPDQPAEVVEASIIGLTADYTSGRTTAHAVTQAHLDRIAAYDKHGPFINSLITVNPRAHMGQIQTDAVQQTVGGARIAAREASRSCDAGRFFVKSVPLSYRPALGCAVDVVPRDPP